MLTLEDLPPSERKDFWGDDADVELRIMKDGDPHKHYFEYDGGNRHIKCKCGVGFIIGSGDELKDGHLYSEGKYLF